MRPIELLAPALLSCAAAVVVGALFRTTENHGSSAARWIAITRAGIVAVAAFIRFNDMRYLGPWMDEGTYLVAGRNIGNASLDFSWMNGWKYGYPLVARLGEVCYGSWLGARYLNALLGLTSVIVAYAFARLIIFEFNKSDSPTKNEARALISLALLAIETPLILSSRLATYDGPAMFCFALAMYFTRRACRIASEPAPPSNVSRLNVASSLAFFLGFLSKYITILFTPFFVVYGFAMARERRSWILTALVPLVVLSSIFVMFWGGDFMTGSKTTAVGPWVISNWFNVTRGTLSYIGAPLLFAAAGLGNAPRQRREAMLLIGGALTIWVYYVTAGHNQGLVKVIGFSVILLAPLTAMGVSRVLEASFRAIASRTSASVTRLVWAPASLLIAGVLFESSIWAQPSWKTTWWEDRAAVVDLETHAMQVAQDQHRGTGEEPRILSSRPFEDMAMNPDLQPFMNRGLAWDAAGSKLGGTQKMLDATFNVDPEKALRLIQERRLDVVVYFEPDYDEAFLARVRKVLADSSYRFLGRDDRPGQTPFGPVRKPSGSYVYVNSALYDADPSKFSSIKQTEAPPPH